MDIEFSFVQEWIYKAAYQFSSVQIYTTHCDRTSVAAGLAKTGDRQLTMAEEGHRQLTMAEGQRPLGDKARQQQDVVKDKPDVTQFDYVLMGAPDMHGIPRGRVVPKDLVPYFCKGGFGIFQGILNFGLNMEIPKQFPEYKDNANGTMLPEPETVHTLQWSSSPERSLGFMFCTMLMPDGQPDPAYTRYAAQRQLAHLDKVHGMRFMSAFECEFMIFEGSDVQRPMGKGITQYANFDLLDTDLDFLLGLMDVLKGSGLPVELLNNEYEQGQYEITMQPTYGVEGADAVFLLRYGLRSFSKRKGYTATFVPRPRYPQTANGFHLNHSLWTVDGHDAFFDASDPEKLSAFGRHWMAGLLHHAPAMCALACPTVNCYQRLHEMLAPGEVFWSPSDRLCLIRAKISDTGAYFENRLPSSACNPYLALAATIAAGLDGVERKLTCPPPGCSEDSAKRFLPRSLGEALDELEKDTVLTEAMGTKLVNYFVSIKRNFDMKHFENNVKHDMSRADVIEAERKYYMSYM